MSAELLSILVLAAMFVLATLLPVNIGALAFVAAFLVGTTVAGLSTDDILAGFPGELAVTLIGVTYLFAIAQNNGTVDWLVDVAVRAVRGRIVAIPWIMFAAAGMLTAFGAVSPAAVAIIAPVALGFAYRYGINPLLMGVLVVHGAQAGGFSPISIYGSITNGIVERSGLPGSPLALFLSSLFINLGVALIAFVLFGGLPLLRRRASDVGPGAGDAPEDDPRGGELARVGGSPTAMTGSAAVGSGDGAGRGGRGSAPSATLPTAPATEADRAEEREDVRATPYRVLTLVGLLGLGISTLFFELDVGLVALTVAVALALVSPQSQRSAVSQISWPVVLLIAGVLTYVAVLEEIGTIEYVSNNVASLGSALLVALLLCYVGGVVSAFASSTALLGAIIPLAVPFLQAGEASAIGVIAALAVSSTVVDVSPFSTNGALVLANAEEEGRDQFYKRLLAFGAVVVAVAPLVTWLVLVVPGWL